MSRGCGAMSFFTASVIRATWVKTRSGVSCRASPAVASAPQHRIRRSVPSSFSMASSWDSRWRGRAVRCGTHGPARLPVVLSRPEVQRLLSRLGGPVWLIAPLMYGSGLRLLECLELRIKDVSFDRSELLVRDGKGGKDRVTILPDVVRDRLRHHLERVKSQHAQDLSAGRGAVALPGALAAKYPAAAREWAWQWVFPATRFYADRSTGERRRHHLHESVVQRVVKDAVRSAGIARPATCHSLRHHADSRIMPTALGHQRNRGGDRALPATLVGMIRGARETRGVDRAGGSGLASRRWAWCARAPAL